MTSNQRWSSRTHLGAAGPLRPRTRRVPFARCGFTLVETLVAMLLFTLFGLAAFASLTMALRQWRMLAKRVNATQNARFVAGIITDELRQGSPNPSAFGYTSQGLSPTAVLKPNVNDTETHELVFNEPNPTNYNPLSSSWDPENPDDYRKVRYFVANNNTEIIREQTDYSGGAAQAATQEVVAHGDYVDLVCDYKQANLVEVTVHARQGSPPEYYHDVRYVTEAYILGQ